MSQKEKREPLGVVSPRAMSPSESDLLTTVTTYESNEPHHIRVPDSGRRAWLVVFGGFLNFIASFGLLNAFGTFESEYEHSLGLNTATVTWIGSIQMFVLFFAGAFIGPAFDKWGARKLMLSGTFLCLISFIACSFATQFYQLLLAQGFLFGFGCALLYYPTTSAVSEWFDQKRALALGLVMSGASAGGAMWPMVLDHLFEKIGTGWTHRTAAAIAIPLMLLSCVLVRERRDIAGHDTAGNEIKASQTSIAKAIWDYRFLWLSGSLLFINCGMMVPFFYIPQYAIDHGISRTTANILLTASYGTSLVGRISTGWVADRIGRFNMLILISTLTSITTLCFIWSTVLPTILVFVLLFGFASGGVVPLSTACVAQTTPDMGYIGLRMGVMMAICSVGTLAGGPATGAIKDSTDSWAGVFIFCSAITFAGTVMLFSLRIVYQKQTIF